MCGLWRLASPIQHDLLKVHMCCRGALSRQTSRRGSVLSALASNGKDMTSFTALSQVSFNYSQTLLDQNEITWECLLKIWEYRTGSQIWTRGYYWFHGPISDLLNQNHEGRREGLEISAKGSLNLLSSKLGEFCHHLWLEREMKRHPKLWVGNNPRDVEILASKSNSFNSGKDKKDLFYSATLWNLRFINPTRHTLTQQLWHMQHNKFYGLLQLQPFSE